MLCNLTHVSSHLGAGKAEVDAEAIRVPAVVLHQLLQGVEGGPPRYEEAALVQLSAATTD